MIFADLGLYCKLHDYYMNNHRLDKLDYVGFDSNKTSDLDLRSRIWFN